MEYDIIIKEMAMAICNQANYSLSIVKRQEEFVSHQAYYLDQAKEALRVLIKLMLGKMLVINNITE